MGGNRQLGRGHDGGEDACASLFLICDNQGVPDHGALARLFWQLGLLADGASPDNAPSPLVARFGAMPVRVETGDAAAQRLEGACASAPPLHFGIAPDTLPAGQPVLALVIDRPAMAQRAEVAQRLCAMAALLTKPLSVRAIVWSPAGLWTSAEELDRAVVAMERAGLPPVLHMVAFVSGVGGADAGSTLCSKGLHWFAGQELQLSGPPGMDEAALLRRGARIAAHVMFNGPIIARQQSDGLEPEEQIWLTPDGRSQGDEPMIVRVTISQARHG